MSGKFEVAVIALFPLRTLRLCGNDNFSEYSMPNVMIRRNDAGALLFYVAKKDMEEVVASVQTDTPESWGGEVALTDGSRWYVDPISPPPVFPTTLRFKRAD